MGELKDAAHTSTIVDSDLGEVEMRPAACPACGEVCDTAACPERPGASPKAGDHMVCAACGARLTYQPNLSLQPMSEAERRALLRQDPAALAMIDRAHRSFKGGK